MSYQVDEKDGYAVVRLTGEVDLNRSPDARRVILDCLQKKMPLLVDLSGVDYIDSSGVASLVEGYQLSRSRQLDFGLIGVSDAAMNVLRLARLDKVFPIYASLEARLKDTR
ncbi:MAG: STAS domain-containing protein [Gammaproteobacteria bacterium]|nr:STAS domain-containing protein [Gammaproteobacteria bacterium]